MKADVQSRAEKEALAWATDYFSQRPGKEAMELLIRARGLNDRLSQMLDAYMHDARGGSQESAQVLRDFAAWLTERGIALPVPMRDFIAEFLRNPKTPRKRGRNSSDLRSRNFAIGIAMLKIVMHWKFSPTRNEVTEPSSAASIVRTALKRGPGIRLSEKSINKVWGDVRAGRSLHPLISIGIS
jgi:hypothetical protein